MSKNVSSPLPPREIILENIINLSSFIRTLLPKTVETVNCSFENPRTFSVMKTDNLKSLIARNIFALPSMKSYFNSRRGKLGKTPQQA